MSGKWTLKQGTGGMRDEKIFPFTHESIALEIFENNNKALTYLNKSNNRIGWIFQQLIKLYANFIIPNISSNMLILDADTIFLNGCELKKK